MKKVTKDEARRLQRNYLASLIEGFDEFDQAFYGPESYTVAMESGTFTNEQVEEYIRRQRRRMASDDKKAKESEMRFVEHYQGRHCQGFWEEYRFGSVARLGEEIACTGRCSLAVSFGFDNETGDVWVYNSVQGRVELARSHRAIGDCPSNAYPQEFRDKIKEVYEEWKAKRDEEGFKAVLEAINSPGEVVPYDEMAELKAAAETSGAIYGAAVVDCRGWKEGPMLEANRPGKEDTFRVGEISYPPPPAGYEAIIDEIGKALGCKDGESVIEKAKALRESRDELLRVAGLYVEQIGALRMSLEDERRRETVSAASSEDLYQHHVAHGPTLLAHAKNDPRIRDAVLGVAQMLKAEDAEAEKAEVLSSDFYNDPYALLPDAE